MQTEQSLHPQLEEIKVQLDAASQKAVSIANNLSFEQLIERPKPDKWSIAECLVHLNLSSEAEIDVLDVAYESMPEKQTVTEKQFKMDLLGRFLKWSLEPPPMSLSKMKTTQMFQPIDIKSPDEVLPEFLAWQEKLKTKVDMINGLSLDEIKVVSPFNRRIKYNLFSFFHILLAHERRHLRQAEKVKKKVFQERHGDARN